VQALSSGIRPRRVLVAAAAVVAASLLALFVPIIIYAFVLAFRVRGAPDQAAINKFAAVMSPALMPWLVRILTLLVAFWSVWRSEAPRALEGLAIGVVAGLLNMAVSLAFGGALSVRSLVVFLVVAGLGWLGGFIGCRMPRRS